MSVQPLSRSAVVVLLLALVSATPALADAIAGCVIPLVPKPDVFAERALNPSVFARLMGKHVTVRFESPREEGIPVYSNTTLLRRGERRPITRDQSDVIRITPGSHQLGRMMDVRTLGRGFERAELGRFAVREVKTLEHDERIRWPRRATHAVTLQFRDAKSYDGKRTNSHMLVMFITGGDGGPLPMIRRKPGVSPLSAGAGAALALVLVGALTGAGRRFRSGS